MERLLPQEISHVLVIAGDLGHRNKQNNDMLHFHGEVNPRT